MKMRVLLLLMALFIAGCASTYKQSELSRPVGVLDRNVGVLISIPEDGWYEDKKYPNSGEMTARAVLAAFSKNAATADLLTNCHGSDCFQFVDVQKYGYYVKPVILHWEDRNTEWSGKPDLIEVQLIVYDAVTQSQLANASYSGKSKWATFGGDHPQDLLPDPTNQYVNSLYKQ